MKKTPNNFQWKKMIQCEAEVLFWSHFFTFFHNLHMNKIDSFFNLKRYFIYQCAFFFLWNWIVDLGYTPACHYFYKSLDSWVQTVLHNCWSWQFYSIEFLTWAVVCAVACKMQDNFPLPIETKYSVRNSNCIQTILIKSKSKSSPVLLDKNPDFEYCTSMPF